MPIISGLTSVQQLPTANAASPAASAAAATDFSSLLSEAMSSVSATESVARSESLALLTGDSANVHNVVLAAEKAEVALQLTLQVRNKVLDAYNEIMRMQI